MSLLDRMLDRSILWSFDRSGFRRHARAFAPGDLDRRLDGRVIALTGANSGLGLATATALAGMGAELWMLCRDGAKAEAARARILEAHPGATLHLHPLDLSDWGSVDAAAALPAPHLDVLIHNAGVLPAERTVLPTGLERTLATNLVGPLRLTARLLPKLRAASAPRVVHVSSGGMYAQRLDLGRLNKTAGGFDGVKAYAQTKRAQVILNAQLAERWRGHIQSHAMHPGWADTPGVRTSIPRFFKVTKGILRTPAQGADTTVWLASANLDPASSGTFWFDRRPAPLHLGRGTRESPAEREALWAQLLDWAGLDAAALAPGPAENGQ